MKPTHLDFRGLQKDISDMTTTVFMNGRSQAVRLPKEFRLPGRLANIRRWGDGILLEPIKPSKWPKGYFEKVKIKDTAFERQPQGDLPSAHQ
jgi:virulence-associated protein VagC